MKKDAILHDSFEVGILLKGIDAVLETLSGVALFFVTPSIINNFIIAISKSELSEDPSDFVFTHLIDFASHLSVSSQSFIAFYLLWHGIVKLFVVGSLWKGKIWAYPTGIIFFFIFIIYQIYRYTFTHSAWLIVLTIFDAIIIYLTWVEYQRIRSRFEHN